MYHDEYLWDRLLKNKVNYYTYEYGRHDAIYIIVCLVYNALEVYARGICSMNVRWMWAQQFIQSMVITLG